jgi:lysozyme
MNMDALIIDLGRDEGRRHFPYTDTVGKWTIGVGHNLTDKGISNAVIDLILAEDLREVVANLNRFIPWWTTLDEVRQRVLGNMCFNLGITRLLEFRQALYFTQSGAYAQAADGMRASLWYRQVGSRAERLARMMETGTDPGDIA